MLRKISFSELRKREEAMERFITESKKDFVIKTKYKTMVWSYSPEWGYRKFDTMGITLKGRIIGSWITYNPRTIARFWAFYALEGGDHY